MVGAQLLILKLMLCIYTCMYVCMYRYLEERRKKVLARKKGLTAEEEQIVEFSDLKGLSEIPSTCTLVNLY